MPKGVDWSEIESGNWNVAKPYTNDKILKWLVLIDDYQTIARFGVLHLENDIFIKDKNLKNTARLDSIRRLIHAIRTLIQNTKFAVKAEDKKILKRYYDRLIKIEKYLPILRIEKKRGDKIIELNINESFFEKILLELDGIKDDVNYRLNKADLIFTSTTEFDPKKAKEAFKDKFINKE